MSREAAVANALGVEVPGLDQTLETPTPQAPAAPTDNNPQPTAAPQQPANPDKPAEQATPPAAPTFNFDEELVKVTNGAFKTRDELLALSENARKLPELETRLRSFEEENTSLKAKVAQSPFANPLVEKMNELYSGGANPAQIEAFLNIQRVGDIDKLSPFDARVLALQIKSGVTADEAKLYLNDQYGINPNDPDFKMEAADEVKLKLDAVADRDFLRTHKTEVSQAPANEAEAQERLYQQQTAEHLQRTEPMATAVVNEVLTSAFKGISVNGKDGDGNITIDLPLSHESREQIAQNLMQMTRAQGLNWPADAEGKKAMQTYTENVLVLQNWKNWIIDAVSKAEMRVRAEYNNPSAIDRGSDNPNKGVTKEQDRVNNRLKALGLA